MEVFFNNIPIYWINLDDSKERFDGSIEQLKDYPNQKRISAIDGRNWDDFFKNNDIIYETDINFSSALIAVICSHIKAIKIAQMNDLDKVCILEDNFNFEHLKYYPYTLDEIIDKAPNDWEIIQLWNYNTNIDKKIDEYLEDGIKIYKPMPCLTGSYYIINKKGIENILKNLVETDGDKKFHFKRKISSPERTLYAGVKYYTVNIPPILYGGFNTTFPSYKKTGRKGSNDKFKIYTKKIKEFLVNEYNKSNDL